jgi:hypothetical protein
VARDEDDADDLLAAILPPDDRLATASAAARSRRRWLGQLATESSTLAGVLLCLAERDEAVTIRCGPWAHTGRLRTVTASLCILELPEIALVPTTAITVVEAAGAVADDRPLGAGPDLATVLNALVTERPAVRLELLDGTEVAGSLLGLGKDVAVIQLTSSIAQVRLPAIACCVLRDRVSEDRPTAVTR